MNWYMLFKCLVIIMDIFGFIYGLENSFYITKLEKKIDELKEKLNTK